MNLFRELKRRNVLRVGLAYLVGAWLIAQVVQLAAESFGAPDWIMKMLIVVLILGFPAIIFFSWAYELTPDGLKRESELALSESVSLETSRRLDYLTITLVALVVVFVIWSRQAPVSGVGEPSAAGETLAQAEAPAVTTDRSIAVLPFVNMSDDPENEYFADGLSEELLNRLAQLPELRVAGRTSAFEYKGQNRDLREIAKNLGVSNILEGSVRRSAGRVRITAQLIRASDGSHLWSQSYDRTIDDIFATQDEIAVRVAESLDVMMNDERRELMRRVGVPNVDAFVAYQKGWNLFAEAHASMATIRAGLEPANAYFRQATELYPGFGDAWYWQADLYQHILTDPESSEEDLKMAAAENDRLLSAAARHAQTPQQKAYSNLTRAIFSNDWTNIKVLLEQAISLQTCAGPNWAEQLFPLGMEQAGISYIETYQKCIGKIDSVLLYGRLIEVLLLTDQKEKALAMANQAITEYGRSTRLSHLRVQALLAMDRASEAVEEARLVDRADPRSGHTLAIAQAVAGMPEQARQEAEAWLALDGRDERFVLELLAYLNRHDEANALAAAIDQRPGGHIALAGTILACLCGAPFDIEATPNFKTRIEEGELQWPPSAPIKLPAPPG